MRRVKFDPFGEEVELKDSTGARSKRLTWVGFGIFWVLVVVVLSARAIYFEPRILDGIRQGAASLQGF